MSCKCITFYKFYEANIKYDCSIVTFIYLYYYLVQMARTYSRNLEDLAHSVGNAQYNITAECIGKVANNISKKALNTHSIKPEDIANHLYKAKSSMDSAWEICKDKMEGECAKHPTQIVGYAGTIDTLARYLTKLPDYKFKKFINYLGQDILRQADADFNRNRRRKKLASHLYKVSNSLLEAGNLL
jgi:hypothetical protein